MTMISSSRPALGRTLTRAGSATAAAAFVVASIATPAVLAIICLDTLRGSDTGMHDLTVGALTAFVVCAATFAVGLSTLGLGRFTTRHDSHRD